MLTGDRGDSVERLVDGLGKKTGKIGRLRDPAVETKSRRATGGRRETEIGIDRGGKGSLGNKRRHPMGNVCLET